MILLSIFVLIRNIECCGSKDRFDSILAQFGFSGISQTRELPHLLPGVRDLTKRLVRRRVPALVINYKVNSERQNEIPNEKRKSIKHGFYEFVLKKKKVKELRKDNNTN